MGKHQKDHRKLPNPANFTISLPILQPRPESLPEQKVLMSGHATKDILSTFKAQGDTLTLNPVSRLGEADRESLLRRYNKLVGGMHELVTMVGRTIEMMQSVHDHLKSEVIIGLYNSKKLNYHQKDITMHFLNTCKALALAGSPFLKISEEQLPKHVLIPEDIRKQWTGVQTSMQELRVQLQDEKFKTFVNQLSKVILDSIYLADIIPIIQKHARNKNVPLYQWMTTTDRDGRDLIDRLSRPRERLSLLVLLLKETMGEALLNLQSFKENGSIFSNLESSKMEAFVEILKNSAQTIKDAMKQVNQYEKVDLVQHDYYLYLQRISNTIVDVLKSIQPSGSTQLRMLHVQTKEVISRPAHEKWFAKAKGVLKKLVANLSHRRGQFTPGQELPKETLPVVLKEVSKIIEDTVSTIKSDTLSSEKKVASLSTISQRLEETYRLLPNSLMDSKPERDPNEQSFYRTRL